MPRKRPARRQPERHLTWLVEFTDWGWDFSFGINPTKNRDDPYMEFRHLRIMGKLLRPAAVQAQRVELIFLPDARLTEEKRKDEQPRCVGSIDLRNGTLQGLLSMPADVLGIIQHMLSAQRLCYATLDAPKLRYRQALVRHYRLQMSYDEDELLSEE